MKTKEELEALKEEVETVGKKLAELSEDELETVTGGMKITTNDNQSWWRTIVDFLNKIKP